MSSLELIPPGANGALIALLSTAYLAAHAYLSSQLPQQTTSSQQPTLIPDSSTQHSPKS